MKYRPGWTVFHLPSIPGCPARAPLAATAAVGVVGDHSVAYMRRASAGGRRPRFLDGATLARVPPSGAAACLLAAEWQAHTQHSAEPWRRLLVALGLHPVDVRGDRLRIHNPAEPTVANVPPRPCPAPPCMFYSSLPGTVAVPVCLQYNGISAHYCNVPRQSEASFAQVIGQSIISNTLVDGGNSLLRAVRNGAARGTRRRA